MVRARSVSSRIDANASSTASLSRLTNSYALSRVSNGVPRCWFIQRSRVVEYPAPGRACHLTPQRISEAGGSRMQPNGPDDFYQMIKPQLCGLLDLLRIGVVFDRAQGDYLYHRRDGDDVAVLALVGGYGSLLFGHHHPTLVAEAHRLLAEGRPIHSQGSRHALAGVLARELSRRAGADYRAVFTNSGAEAVEAAMKHAILETGSRTFIALEKGFHGKTLGAVQLTANQDYREPFLIDGLTVHFVRINDIAHLDQTFARTGSLAGLIFEPIQGEGGVREISAEFAQRAAALCSARGAPLMAD